MKKIPNFKETKTTLADLISTQTQTKSSTLQKPLLFNWMEQSTPKNLTPVNIIYDDFIYTDKLTKKRIRMCDAKMSYQNGKHTRKSSTTDLSHINPNQQKKKRQNRNTRHNSNLDMEKQLTDLNQCFVMLKSTEMFKLNSLRQKIFGSIDRSAKNTLRKTSKDGDHQHMIQGDINDMLTKKKKIRQILQDSVKQANINEFRKYFSNQNHKINHKIVQMNRKIPSSFNKNNIEKIIETLAQADKKEENTCTFLKRSSEDVEFPGQQKLKTDLIEYMKKQMKQNGEYLVTPEKKKLLYQRLYSNAISKSKNFDENEKKNFNENQITNSINNTFDDDFSTFDIEINIPSEQKILQPIVNQHEATKPRNSNKGLIKTSLNNSQKQKKRTQYPFNQKKQRHKKQNTCINFSYSNTPYKQVYKQGQISTFLNDFSFSPCGKNKEISMIKTKFERNQRLKTTKLSLRQQKFLFMVENGLLFDVQKQILLNQDYLFMKDQNEDNLLHICAKNHFSEMFTFIIQRYVKCGLKQDMIQKRGQQILKDKLLEKNKNNKNVLEVAKLYQAEQIIAHLARLKDQLNLREYVI